MSYDCRTNHWRMFYDIRATFMRHSRDIRTMFARWNCKYLLPSTASRRSHERRASVVRKILPRYDVRQNIAWFNLLVILSRIVSFMSQLVRNLFLFISQICRVPKLLRLNCEGLATSSRRVRDTRDDFVRPICEEFCFIKFLNMFKMFATTLRHLATHARKLKMTDDCFKTALRPTRDVCRQLSQNSRSLVR